MLCFDITSLYEEGSLCLFFSIELRNYCIFRGIFEIYSSDVLPFVKSFAFLVIMQDVKISMLFFLVY